MNDFEAQLKNAAQEQVAPNLERSIWLNIKDQVNQQRKTKIRRRIKYFAMAASVLLVLGLLFSQLQPNVDKEQVVLQEYGLENYEFPQKVEQKLIALNGSQIPEQQVDQFNALKSQLYFLDEQYLNYLEYIEQNGYQEFIGIQIQNYYEVKIELLDKIQKEIEKLKSKDHDSIKKVNWQI